MTQIIPKDCMCTNLASNSDSFVDCNHADLARFPSTVDRRFVDFASKISQMISRVLIEDNFSDLPDISKKRPSMRLGSDPLPDPSPSPPGSETPKEAPNTPRKVSSASRGGFDEQYHYWWKGKWDEEGNAQWTCFLRSLRGWSETNTGSHISLAPRTCRWLYDEPSFKDWKADPGLGTLLLLGEAGQGKTYLAREMLDYLRADYPSDIVMGYFCNPGEKPPHIWEYFTWELLTQESALFAEIPNRYRDRNENSPPMSMGAFVDIWKGFRGAGSRRSICLIVDGLEQCGDEHFEEFFSTLEKIRAPVILSRQALSQSPDKRPKSPTVLKVIFTCRSTAAVNRRRGSSAAEAWPSLLAVEKDVASYVDWRVDRLLVRDGGLTGDASALKQSIKKSASSFWPFAKFAVEQLEQSLPASSDQRFDTEARMPAGLKLCLEAQVQSYIRSAMRDRYASTAITFLASFDESLILPPCHVADMLRGLHDEDELRDLNLVKLLSENNGGMLLCETHKHIAFTHESVAYCMRDLLSPEQRHANMAFICLNYLLRDTFQNPFPLFKEDDDESDSWLHDTHPFYPYAALNWPEHLRNAGNLAVQLLPLLRAFMDKECSQYRNWCSWNDWGYSKPPGVSSHTDPTVLVLLLHGCVNVLEHLLSPQKSPSYWSLPDAVKSWIPGHSSETNEEEFLAARNWPETTNGIGQSALIIAINNGKPDVVDFVLQWELNVNARSKMGLTPLIACFFHAVATQTDVRIGLLEELLRRGAEPNVGDEDGNTPLHYASSMGSLEAARLLLIHGALANITGVKGYSALEKAFLGRGTKVFAELVDWGADVDVLWSVADQVPLSQCIIDDDLDNFRILIDVADVNGTDGNGVAPIHHACEIPGRHEYLGLLLSRPDLDLDVVDRDRDQGPNRISRNALSVAAVEKNYLAVEMLLSAGAEPGPLPLLDSIPLYHAVMHGHLEMVRTLLAYQSPVNTYTHRWFPRTPLSAAVHKGNTDMVTLLLENGADPTTEDAYGATGPLWLALSASSPNLDIIRKLLEARIPPDVNFVRDGGADTTSLAAQTGNSDIVRVILDHGPDLSLWLEPARHPSPLHVAAELGFVDICDSILQHEPRLLNAQSSEGLQNEPPLNAACYTGQPEVVRFLLEKGARPDQVSFHRKESALLIACDEKNYECVKLLLEAAPEMVNVAAYDGYSPLMSACGSGDGNIIEALLKAGADITQKDLYGKTCIASCFSESNSGQAGRVLELLMKYGLDINAVDSADGFTVLGAAITTGSPRDVRWLLEHGADSLRCQQSPSEAETWDNALQVATLAAGGSIVDVLLEPQWGLLDHLGDKDAHGRSHWNVVGFSRTQVEKMTKVYNACEIARAETGKDLFGDLIRQPNINGRTIADLVVGNVACTRDSWPQTAARVASWIRKLLSLDFRRESHIYIVEEIGWLLLMLGNFDREGTALLSAVISFPIVGRGVTGFCIDARAWDHCAECGGQIRRVCMGCGLCAELRCEQCVDMPDAHALHEHDWVPIPVQWDPEWKPEKVGGILQWVHDELMVISQNALSRPATPEDEASDVLEDPSPEDRHRTSLQLATLHAFGYLAIRRPLFTPYLPLSPATETLIAAWMPMIKDRRWFIERRDLAFEMHWSRRQEEVLYIQRGLGVGYVDEEDVRRGWVLKDVRHLFRLPPSEEKGASKREEKAPLLGRAGRGRT